MAAVFSIGDRVQENGGQHRKGTVSVVQGTGTNATVWVRLDGWHPAAFRPAQLVKI